MVDLAKKLIDNYNSNPKAHVVSDYKSKTTTIGIDSIAYEDTTFNKDKQERLMLCEDILIR